ncbi:hypothetical protein FNV43_RR08183 [Rhamnella rubrinervis]|uniref:Cytochrome c domain-containing protein n=1 Tax=Rhamnella rubrinervis TaxID=2594499 RepID=A0A8K0HG18_9ROSA|nr:hypothetical protein FNV43_RR08183 [Rhamnella rubrinervis]
MSPNAELDIGHITNNNKLEDIFSEQFEVVGVMVSIVHEMSLVANVYHVGVRKPNDITFVVENKLDVDIDTNRVDKGTSVDVRLCAIEERLSIMDSRMSFMDIRLSSIDNRLSFMDSTQSSMDSRLSSMESKLDYVIKLLSSTYNTTRVQNFNEVEGDDVGVGVAHRTCDQRIDHVANDLVPPMSISSSPIAESEYSVKIFIQMSDKKLAGGRTKRKAAQTIESPYDYQLLWRKMISTLPLSGSVTFDPYRSVPDEIARQYAHFMDTSAGDQIVELFWITVGKDYFRDIECSPNWLTSDELKLDLSGGLFIFAICWKLAYQPESLLRRAADVGSRSSKPSVQSTNLYVIMDAFDLAWERPVKAENFLSSLSGKDGMATGYGLDFGKSQVEKQFVSEGHKTSIGKTRFETQIEEIKVNRIFTGETTIGKNGVAASEHVNQNGFQKPSFASVVSGAPNTFSQSMKSQNVPIRKGKFVSVRVDDDAYQERAAICKRYGRMILTDLVRGIGIPLKIDNITLSGNFGHFARVLVDIDLSGFVPDKLLLEITDDCIKVNLFFKSFPNFCTACHSVGHSVTKCKSVIGKASSKIGPHGKENENKAPSLTQVDAFSDSDDEPGDDADDIVEDEWQTLQGAGSSNPSKKLDGTPYVGQQSNTMAMVPFVSSDARTAAQRNLDLVASHPLVSETYDQNLWNLVKRKLGRPKRGETVRRLQRDLLSLSHRLLSTLINF